MYELQFTSQFRRDLKSIKKRGYDRLLLQKIIETLQKGEPLDVRYKDHPLKGDYAGFRECHIQSDWLLIYTIDTDQLVLTLTRSGTHSDLFA